MKKTIAALFALICVAGGANAALVSSNKNTGNTAIVAQAADELSVLEGIHAGHYSYKYADTSIYTTKISVVGFEKTVDGKKQTLSSWTDEKGNEYAVYNVSVTSITKENVVNEYCIGIKKAKTTILDAVMSDKVDISALDGYTPSDKNAPETLLSDLKGKNAKVIADSAFANSYLKTIDLTGVEYIGKNAFNKCAYITEIEIPKTVKFVGEGVFSGSGLKKLTVNNDMPVIPKSFCSETALTEVTFAHPEYIREIGVSAFAKTPLSAPIFNQWYGKDVSNYETLYVDDSAYEGCSSIKEINMPDNVLFLGKKAFYQNTSAKQVIFGKNTWAADQNCFNGCTALVDIEFNDVLTTLAGGCFQGCTSLKYVVGLPATMCDWTEEFSTTGYGIGDGVFSGCTSLIGAVIPTTLQRIAPSMFEGDINLTTVRYANRGDYDRNKAKDVEYLTAYEKDAEGNPKKDANGKIIYKVGPATCENKVKIKDKAFKDCVKLTDVNFPAATDIGASAFEGCTGVKTVSIPKSQYIRDSAFKNCSGMNSFTAGECKVVGNNALEGCSAMEKIELLSDQYGGNVKEDAKGITITSDPDETNSSSGYIFKNCTAAKKITIKGENKVKLCAGMFSGCTELTEIGGDISGVSVIGKECFSNCSAITKLNLPALKILESSAFMNCSALKSISDSGVEINAEDYGSKCFQNCSQLDIEVRGVISTIGANAFQNSAVKKVSIDGMVGGTVVIGASAFADCQYLESATILSPGVDKFSVGASVFSKCPILKKAVYEGPIITASMFIDCPELVTVETSADVFSEKAFSGCTKLEQVIKKGTSEPVTAKEINGSAFMNCAALKNTSADTNTIFKGNTQYSGCSSITSASVSTLTPGMFQNCTSLPSISLTSDITTIPASCFQNCTSLGKFSFGKITQIGDNAFENTAFTAMTLSNMTTIGKKAFANSQSLAKVTVNAEKVDTSAFAECPALKKIEITADSVESNAFAKCQSLSTATLNVKNIGASAFSDDTALKEVTFADGTPESVGASAFLNCNKLSVLKIAGNPTLSSKCIGFVGGKVNPTFVLAGEPNSSVQEYADKNGINFQDMSGEIVIPTTEAPTEKPTQAPTEKPTEAPTETPSNRLAGDANLSGDVTISDAVAILQHLANQEVFPFSDQAKSNADVDGKPGVTGNDAATIQLYDAGVIKELT